MSVADNVRDFVDQQAIVALATVASNGTPNVAPMYWKLWYDDKTLLLLDNYMKTSKANVLATGKASLSAWNAELGEGYQLKGTAEYFSEGLHMDAAVAYMDKQKPGSCPKGVVALTVTHVYIQTPGDHAGDLLE
jgi:predicted pyridoxine 5'-phosphate oxidase superfamily flavin-nucleotide-binding protein